MLTFAIATFFALALSGALLTIAAMFHAYRHKIKSVIVAGLIGDDTDGNSAIAPVISQRNHSQSLPLKPHQIKGRRFSPQPVPLRAAA